MEMSKYDLSKNWRMQLYFANRKYQTINAYIKKKKE